MFKNFLKKQSLFLSWLLSYISILLVPIIISGVIYQYSQNIVRGEVNRSNFAMLSQLKETVDSRMEEIKRIATQISLNQRLTTAVRVESDFGTRDQFNLYELKNDLADYRKANDLIDDIYIYFKNTDTVMSITHVARSKDFYEFSLLKNMMDYDEFIQYLNNSKTLNYRIRGGKLDNGQTMNVVSLSTALPIINWGEINATINILLDEAKLIDMLENAKWLNQGITFILDETGQAITSNVNMNSIQNITFENTEKEQELLPVKLDGLSEPFTGIYLSSSVKTWKYVSIIPDSIFYEKLKYIRNFSAIGIILCMVIGGVVAFIFTKKNYTPVRCIIEDIKEKVGLSFDREKNEYIVIRESLNSAIEENKKTVQKLEKQTNILRNSCLIRLIKGNYKSPISIEALLNQYDVSFENKSFIVCTFFMEKVYGEHSNEDIGFSTEDLSFEKYIINNVIEEMVKNNYKVYFVEVDGLLTSVVNFNAGNTNPVQKLAETITKAQEAIGNNFSINFTSSISNIHHSVMGISQAYHEAVEAMEHKMVYQETPVITYAQIKNQSYHYGYSMTIEQKLSNFIKVGDYENASDFLEQLIKDKFAQKSFSIEIGKLFIYDITNTILKVMEDTDEDFINTNISAFQNLLSNQTLFEMKNNLRALLTKACHHISSLRDLSSEDNLSKEIMKYVSENYMDINLDVSSIGDNFNLTPYYLSMLFKKQSGEKLVDYINKVRINEAKRLLKENSLSIQEICQKVGYTSSAVFIRIFKRYNGITPGKYKGI